MSAKPFTALSVKSLPQGKHADAGCKGLYLYVRGESRTWTMRYMHDGKQRDMGLGSILSLSLAEARAKVSAHWVAIHQGINPNPSKAAPEPAKAEVNTFRTDAIRFHAREAGQWDERKAKEWLQGMAKHVFPIIGHLDTAKVTVADVLSIVEPLWTTCHQTARRLNGQIRQIIDYASDTCDDDSRFGANPATKAVRRLPKLNKAYTAHVPHKAICWKDAPALFKRLAEIDSVASVALRAVLLCGTPRASEVTGMEWSEIEGDVWHVPAARMKSGTARDIPLTQAALDLLGSVTGRTGLVFKGRKRGTSVAPMIHNGGMVALLHKLGVASDVHGLRSTFRTWASDHAETVKDHDAAEICLDHVIGNKVQRAYDRIDMLPERRALLERWAAYLAG